ncbi:MAG: hypothetical protein MR051_09080 [Lentisphaeria bacterium]|nr:hypothetical protein [Lentisphaeria bacterium]
MNQKLKDARQKLFLLQETLHQHLSIIQGETAAPGYRERARVADPTRKELCENYLNLIAPEYRAFAEAVREELADTAPFPAAPPIPDEKLWLWGGPTPEWGGSLQPDTLLKTADWYHIDNGVYVYGPTTEAMLSLHAPLKKLLAMVTTQCRAPGQQPESDEQCAENLSRISLQCPNIVGGMMDDMTSHAEDIPPEKIAQVAAVSRALKKHNPALKLYGVVYRHELGKKDFSPLLPYLDGVSLWFWNQEELLDLGGGVEACRRDFPGKEIFLGLFLHDYGTSDAETLPELLIHQLKGARALAASGKIDALIVLGDREILKWPEAAAAVKGFLMAK